MCGAGPQGRGGPPGGSPREGLSDLSTPRGLPSRKKHPPNPSLPGPGVQKTPQRTHAGGNHSDMKGRRISFTQIKKPDEDAEGSESHQTKPQIKITGDPAWESGSVFKTSSRKLPLGLPCHPARPSAHAGPLVALHWASGHELSHQ